MVLKHHTLSPFDRKPQGAVAAGGQVRLRVTAEGDQMPLELFLRVWNGAERRYPMRSLGVRNGKTVYEAQIGVGDTPNLLWYRFEGETREGRVVLGAPDDHTGCGEGVMGSEESFQVTVYDAAYDTPAWMREGVMYQIMVDRFCRGEGTDALMHAKDGQNIILHDKWDEMPFLNISENGDNFANDFFGGNLEGVRQKLPYLKRLGVSVLYFNPIFCARTNHKYDTSDYRRIDPMFGDEQALARLCKEAEALGMRVMLDGVFSHVGDDSLYFNRRGTHGEHVGAYRDPHSPYFKWFTFRHWPDDYECWWGFKTLPNVNEMDEDFASMMAGYENGIITEERLNDALHRILALKAHMGLHKKAKNEIVPPVEVMEQVVGCEEHKAMAREISEKGITLVKYKDEDVLPMIPSRYKRIMIVSVSGLSAGVMGIMMAKYMGGGKKSPAERLRDKLIEKGFDAFIYESPLDALAKRAAAGEKVDINMYFAGKTPIKDFVENQDLIITLVDIAGGFQPVARPGFGMSKGGGEIPWYVHELPVIVIGCGQPFVLADIPQARTYINTYDSADQTFDALIEKLMSGSDAFIGEDPVDAYCGLWDTHR